MSKLQIPSDFQRLSNTGSNYVDWLRKFREQVIGQGHNVTAAFTFSGKLPMFHGCNPSCYYKASGEEEASLVVKPPSLMEKLELPSGLEPFPGYTGMVNSKPDASTMATPMKASERRSSMANAFGDFSTPTTGESISSSMNSCTTSATGYGWYYGDPLGNDTCSILKTDLQHYLRDMNVFVNSLEMMTTAIVTSLDNALRERAMQSQVFREVVEKNRPDILIMLIENLMSTAGIGGAKPICINLSIGNDLTKLFGMRLGTGDIVVFINKFLALIDKLHTQGFNPKRDVSMDHTYAVALIMGVGYETKYKERMHQDDILGLISGEKLTLDYAEALIKKWHNDINTQVILESDRGKSVGQIKKAIIKKNGKSNDHIKNKSMTSKKHCLHCKKDGHWASYCSAADAATREKFKQLFLASKDK